MKLQEILKNKNFQIGISVLAVAVSAYLTRNYWMPSTGSIVTGSIDWDNKIVPTEVILQGSKFTLPDYETVYKDGSDGYTELYKTNGNKRFTVTSDSILLQGNPVLTVTIYKGKLDGLATTDYSKITLASIGVDFNNRKIYDLIKTEKENKLVEVSK